MWKEPTEWKKIFSTHTSDRALISKIYKELTKLYTKNKKNPINKWAKELDGHFTEENIQVIKTYMKKCSTSLVIREMQTKTTLRFHLTPIRMAIIKNTSNNRCWHGCGDKGTLLYCWWCCKLVQPHWKAVWSIPRRLGMAPPFEPVISLLSLYPKHLKSAYINVYSSLVHNS